MNLLAYFVCCGIFNFPFLHWHSRIFQYTEQPSINGEICGFQRSFWMEWQSRWRNEMRYKSNTISPSHSINDSKNWTFDFFWFRNDSHLFDSQSTKYVLFERMKEKNWIFFPTSPSKTNWNGHKKHICNFYNNEKNKTIQGCLLDMKIRFQYTFVKMTGHLLQDHFLKYKKPYDTNIFPRFDWNRIFRIAICFVVVVPLVRISIVIYRYTQTQIANWRMNDAILKMI